MGFNGIWINPIYESPFGDAGYDVSDFYKVAPRYGTNEDFKKLASECKKRGIKIILDLVAVNPSDSKVKVELPKVKNILLCENVSFDGDEIVLDNQSYIIYTM